METGCSGTFTSNTLKAEAGRLLRIEAVLIPTTSSVSQTGRPCVNKQKRKGRGREGKRSEVHLKEGNLPVLIKEVTGSKLTLHPSVTLQRQSHVSYS